ncbi:MAG: hypothetical protein U0797_00935 [Gemmataceae bacterium]
MAAAEHLTPDDREIQHHVEYAVTHAAARHREMEGYAHERCREFNERFWGGRLGVPHVLFNCPAARAVGVFRPRTPYGAPIALHVHDGFALGTNRSWVVEPFPAEGTRLALDDLLCRLTIEQALYELHDLAEGDAEFLAAFTAECNRVGNALGLVSVLPRRRARSHRDLPVVTGWPFNVRPAGYYLGHVTPAFVRLAQGAPPVRRSGSTAAPAACTIEYCRWLLLTGKQDRLLALLDRELARNDDRRFNQLAPADRAIEAGLIDLDGQTPMAPISIDQAWLRWQGGLVARMVEDVVTLRQLGSLGVLADALEDSGCGCMPLLRHLRARAIHTPRCFALRLLHAVAKSVLAIRR